MSQVVSGSVTELRERTANNRLVHELMRATGSRQRSSAETGEVGAWKKSLPVLLDLVVRSGLDKVQVILEHRLPYSPKRVDAILCGREPGTGDPSYVLVELKQWSAPIKAEAGGYRVNGLDQLQLHPGEQVFGYCRQLTDFHPDLTRKPHQVRGIAYMHNAEDEDCRALNKPKMGQRDYLVTRTRASDMEKALRRVLDVDADAAANRRAADELLDAKAAPARTLMTTAAKMISERDTFVLLDEQQLAYDMVMDAVRASERGNGAKRIVIVLGGPGSGKSAIALSLFAKLARRSKVVHATGSRAFTRTLWKRLAGDVDRVKDVFRYFFDFDDRVENSLDVIICDEAHRIRGGRPKLWRGGGLRNQVDALIDVAKVPVFLLDEHQVVRPNEIGTLEYIQLAADRRGCDVEVVRLDGQFRCGGSALFDEWVRRLLGLTDKPPIAWSDLVADSDDEYAVRAEDSPAHLEDWLRERMRSAGGTARMAAGFCWKWSDPVPDGWGGHHLVEDIEIGDWKRPWNTQDQKNVPEVDGAPPAALWASDPRGFGQIGCIYTAQGFEYDWAGVIFGRDLVVREGEWVAQIGESKDESVNRDTTRFDELVRNTYKVLLTRGMQGVCLYSVDEATNEFLRKYSR